MAKFSTRISRLAVELEKDGLWGDSFANHPEKELAEKLGKIFGVAELIDLPDSVLEGFFEILEDLKTEYYLPPWENEYGVEKRFEECLQRANRRINKIINQSVEKIDLANINVLIGLIYKEKIFLSQIGENQAFLFHQKKKHDVLIIDIVKETSKKTGKINPEKMFSNIISGAIGPRDCLFFANQRILEYLSPHEIKEIVSENTALTAVRELEQILNNQATNGNFYAIIIQAEEAIEVEESQTLSPRTVAKEKIVPPQTSIANLINTQEKTEQYLTPSLMPSWQKILILILRQLGIALKFIYKYGRIALVKIIAKISDLIKTKKLNPAASTAKTETQPTTYSFAQKFKEKSWQAAQKIAKKTIDLETYRKILPLGKEKSFSQNLNNWLNDQIRKFIGLKRYQQVLIVAAFVVFFFFCQSIVWQGQGQNNVSGSDLTAVISQIEEKINTAEAQNIFNDETASRASLTEAKTLLAQLPDKRKYQTTKSGFEERIAKIEQALQKVTYLESPELIANLANQNTNADLAGLTKAGDSLFAFDRQNQDLYQIKLTDKQTLGNQLVSNLNHIQKIAAIDDKNIILLNNDKEFYRFNLDKKAAESILNTESPVKDFCLYGNKIYTLQLEKNQVYKHLPTTVGYNQGSGWILDKADIKNSWALTIDGGLYLLTNNNRLKYFSGNKFQEEIGLPEFNPALTDRAQIFTNADSTYVYILDPNGQRVIVVDKKGQLKIQYTSKEFTDLRAMAVAEKEKKIYLLSGNKVFGVDIGF